MNTVRNAATGASFDGGPGDLPSFSIVVPTFNRSATVCKCLQSLGGIDWPGSFEIIVVVDGSTDDTVSAVNSLDLELKPIVIEQSNQGAAAARNRGAAAARGDVILFLDDDMIANSDVLIHHAASYREKAIAVVGESPPSTASPESFFSPGFEQWFAARPGELEKPFEPMDVLSGHLSVKRKIFENIGGFDESLTQGGKFSCEDMDLGFRLFEAGKVVRNPEAVCEHHYVVTARQLLDRTPAIARADVHFAALNPAWGQRLFDQRKGANTRRARVLWRPLAKVPLAPTAAHLLARIVSTMPGLRGSRTYGRARKVYENCREVIYWSEAMKAANGRRFWND